MTIKTVLYISSFTLSLYGLDALDYEKIMTKVKPMSMKRINIILEEISDYQLEKLDNGEIVIVKKEE